MTNSELKLELFRKIDELETSKLKQLSVFLKSLVSSKPNYEISDDEEWNTLSEPQQKGLIDAINEFDQGREVSHKEVMKNYKKKYNL